jgi:hypothetical protein
VTSVVMVQIYVLKTHSFSVEGGDVAQYEVI